MGMSGRRRSRRVPRMPPRLLRRLGRGLLRQRALRMVERLTVLVRGERRMTPTDARRSCRHRRWWGSARRELRVPLRITDKVIRPVLACGRRGMAVSVRWRSLTRRRRRRRGTVSVDRLTRRHLRARMRRSMAVLMRRRLLPRREVRRRSDRFGRGLTGVRRADFACRRRPVHGGRSPGRASLTGRRRRRHVRAAVDPDRRPIAIARVDPGGDLVVPIGRGPAAAVTGPTLSGRRRRERRGRVLLRRGGKVRLRRRSRRRRAMRVVRMGSKGRVMGVGVLVVRRRWWAVVRDRRGRIRPRIAVHVVVGQPALPRRGRAMTERPRGGGRVDFFGMATRSEGAG